MHQSSIITALGRFIIQRQQGYFFLHYEILLTKVR